MPSERYIPSREEERPSYDPELMLAELRKALARLKKTELIAAMIVLARDDTSMLRTMVDTFDVELPITSKRAENVKTLVAATRLAILDATAFDERRINYNFNYDHRAYTMVERNFKQMVATGLFAEVMELSVELMRKGSYQIEMSDEGMMQNEIEACLKPVIEAVIELGLTPKSIKTWCDKLRLADSGGFVCERERAKLLKSVDG